MEAWGCLRGATGEMGPALSNGAVEFAALTAPWPLAVASVVHWGCKRHCKPADSCRRRGAEEHPMEGQRVPDERIIPEGQKAVRLL